MYGEFYHQITVDDRNLLDSGDGTPVNLVNVRKMEHTFNHEQ